MEALVRYRKAAFYAHDLTLRTELAKLSRASPHFDYAPPRAGKVIATAYPRHGCVDLPGCRLIRTPEPLLRLAPRGS